MPPPPHFDLRPGVCPNKIVVSGPSLALAVSFPTALMVAPGINGYTKELDKRPAMLKPEQAKKLLADAGYPNGFEVTLDCPTDRPPTAFKKLPPRMKRCL